MNEETKSTLSFEVVAGILAVLLRRPWEKWAWMYIRPYDWEGESGRVVIEMDSEYSDIDHDLYAEISRDKRNKFANFLSQPNLFVHPFITWRDEKRKDATNGGKLSASCRQGFRAQWCMNGKRELYLLFTVWYRYDSRQSAMRIERHGWMDADDASRLGEFLRVPE